METLCRNKTVNNNMCSNISATNNETKRLGDQQLHLTPKDQFMHICPTRCVSFSPTNADSLSIYPHLQL